MVGCVQTLLPLPGGAVSVSVTKPVAPFDGSTSNGIISVPAEDFGALTLEKASKKLWGELIDYRLTSFSSLFKTQGFFKFQQRSLVRKRRKLPSQRHAVNISCSLFVSQHLKKHKF